MAASHIGDVYVLVDEGYRADPFSGAVVYERTFDGTTTDILALTATLIAQGARVSRRSSGGQNVLVAQWNRDPDGSVSDEVPADVWNDEMQTEEVSLFDTHAAIAEALTAVTNGVVSSVAQYKKDIEDSVKEGEVSLFDPSVYTVAAQIYNLMARGVSAIPVTRPVLTRNRTFSVTYEGRNQMEYRQKVWTTAALISEFVVPTAVQSRLPDNPTAAETPSGTVWGWRLTVDRSSYNIATGKVTEDRAWVFGAHVESFFTVVT